MKANHDIFYPRNSMSTPLSRRISLEKVLLPVRVVNVRVLATTFVDIGLLVLVLISSSPFTNDRFLGFPVRPTCDPFRSGFLCLLSRWS